MHELLRKRILRRLENLPDQQGYQVLDYIEFLDTRYGTGDRRATPAERIGDAVEDTMRAVRLPAAAIRGTMGAVDSASRLMDRLAQAGKAAVDELGRSLEALDTKPGDPGDTVDPPRAAEPPRDESSGGSA